MAAALATPFGRPRSLSAILLAAHAAARGRAAALTVAMDRSLTLAERERRRHGLRRCHSRSEPGRHRRGPRHRTGGPFADDAGRSRAVRAGGFTVAAGSLPSVARPLRSQLHLPVPRGQPAGVRRARTGSSSTVQVGRRCGGDGRHLDGKDGRAHVSPWTWPSSGGRRSAYIEAPDGSFIDTALEQACAPAGRVPRRVRRPAGRDRRRAARRAGTLPALAGSAQQVPRLALQPGHRAGAAHATARHGRRLHPRRWLRSGVPGGRRRPGGEERHRGPGRSGRRWPRAMRSKWRSAPTPAPILGLLATQGWRDGFEQIQLGKQELAQTMGLGLPPAGAWSPGLDLTAASLGDYGQASIDHVLVDAAVAADLNEPIARGHGRRQGARRRNDRVTLVLRRQRPARSSWPLPGTRESCSPGIAAVLASGDRDALVLTPDPDFALPPGRTWTPSERNCRRIRGSAPRR